MSRPADQPGVGRPYRRRVLVGTLLTATSNGWAMLLALVSLPLLLHGLGAVAFGLWALLQTFSATNGWFSLLDAGFGTAATREVAQRLATDDESGVLEAIASTLAVVAVLAVGCGGMFALIGPTVLPTLFSSPGELTPALRTTIMIFAAQIVVDLVTGAMAACLEGLQRVDRSRMVEIARRTAITLATTIAALTTGELVPTAGVAASASLVGLLVGTVVLSRSKPAGAVKPSLNTVRSLFRYARTVAILRPLGILETTMDRLIVGAVLGPAAVTLVEVATQVRSGVDAMLSSATYAVVSSASWLHARGDRGALRELLATGTRYALLVTAPVAGVAVVIASPGLRLWVGPRYADAVGLVPLAIASSMAVAPLQAGSNLLLGAGHAMAIFRAAAMALAVNLVASIVLVHVVGIAGVFAGTLLSMVVLVPLLGRAVLSVTDVSVREFLRGSVLPVLPPTMVMLVVGYAALLLPLQPAPGCIASGGLALASYAAVALRWSMRPGELRELRSTILGSAS